MDFQRFGVISDTHNVDRSVIEQIVAEFKSRGVDLILHCGDIMPQHLDAKLFGDFPVICALVANQPQIPEYVFSPAGWAFTRPDDRVVNLGTMRVYVGHQRSIDFLLKSEQDLRRIIDEIHKRHDGLRIMVAGHTHHQILVEDDPVLFINPGAAMGGYDGYEFALIDLEKKEVIFSRIPLTPSHADPFTIGVISDTGNIMERDENFWFQLAEEFRRRDVSQVIHCGNIWSNDIGRQEFAGFNVFCYLGDDQVNKFSDPKPKNWHIVSKNNPIVEINGYRFYIEYSLGVDFFERSEYSMSMFSRQLSKQYHHIDFVLCGLIHSALYEEGDEVTIINPGDARKRRKFVTICLPRNEVTFGSVSIG